MSIFTDPNPPLSIAALSQLLVLFLCLGEHFLESLDTVVLLLFIGVVGEITSVALVHCVLTLFKVLEKGVYSLYVLLLTHSIALHALVLYGLTVLGVVLLTVLILELLLAAFSLTLDSDVVQEHL